MRWCRFLPSTVFGYLRERAGAKRRFPRLPVVPHAGPQGGGPRPGGRVEVEILARERTNRARCLPTLYLRRTPQPVIVV